MSRIKNKNIVQQVAEYMVAGGAFFWSGYATFALFDAVFGAPLFVAKQVANIVGLTVNYILVDSWVFKNKKINKKNRTKNQKRRLGRYAIITVINFGIDYLIVSELKEVGISPYIGQFASAGFFTIWNFLWYKYWVFAPQPPIHKANHALRGIK